MNERPNILLITSDQHRADTMGVYGHPVVQTPHLDQLAFEGVRFTAAFSDCPVCIPARTTMITGRQAHKNGIPSYSEHARVSRRREDFLGSLITAAGYQTHLVGKTHWHTEPSFRAGFEGVTWSALMRKEHVRRGMPASYGGIGFNELGSSLSYLPPDLQLTGWTVDRATEFAQLRDRSQPFFLWVSIQDPHPPFTIHEPYYSMYDTDAIPEPIRADWSSHPDQVPRAHFMQQAAMKTGRMSAAALRKSRSVYYGMVTNMDHQLGRLFGTLMYQGDWKNTLVIYTTDHGEFLGDHGAGKKSSFCEAAARIPFIVRFPDSWRNQDQYRVSLGKECGSLIELADLLPTICDIAGARVPADADGVSILPLLRDPASHIHDELHGHIDDAHMLRDRSHKYLYYADDGSELLFSADDRDDERPIARRGRFGAEGNVALLDSYRTRLALHLRGEGHPHAVSDGDGLLDKNLPKPSLEEALAADQSGLPALGFCEYPLGMMFPLN